MKNWRKNIAFIVLLLTCLNGNAQSYSAVVNNLHLRVSPLSLIDIYNGSSYKLGFEKKICKATSVYADFGGYLKNFNQFKNYSGFNVDLGLKYYLVNKEINQGTYLTLNYFYKKQSFDYRDTILANPSYYTTYRTQKNVSCLNINFGYLEVFKERLVLDVSGGLGVRFRNSTSTLTSEELDKAQEYGDSQSLYFLVRPGNNIWLNFNVRLKIGYRIF